MNFQVERVASGLNQPLYATTAPGDPHRLFILEKGTGDIEILNLQSGTLNSQPFMTVPGINASGEGGLLGLAFHPNYQSNDLFYVNSTQGGPFRTTVRSFQRTTADTANPGSAAQLISYNQPFANHNGGWMGFNPIANAANDGTHYLYISSGDGGSGNDPGDNGQDTTNLLGKMLRIDVNGDDFPSDPNRNYAVPASNPLVDGAGGNADEIWSYGLRNPWRPSFDRATGDLYIADVGQSAREEINVQPADSTGGENYGWRLREGTIATPSGGVGGPAPPGAIDPIYDYQRGFGPFQGNSVTGGFVYRGLVPELQGKYLFADFISGNIWSLEYDGSDPSTFDGTNFTDLQNITSMLTPDVGSIDSIVSFGEDNAGNLFIVDIGGEVFRITPTLQTAVIPEPSTLSLVGLAAMLLARRRRRIL